MKLRTNATRGMTIPEVIISFGILMLVLSAVTLFFRQAFTHMTMTTENMTNEQMARVAMSKVNVSLSQASVDTSTTDVGTGTPMPAVINWTPTSIAYFRVQTLVPAALLINPVTQAPDPGYNVHIISYDPVARTIDEYVTTWTIYNANGPSPAPTVLAKNVSDFQIANVSSAAGADEYQFQLTLNNILNPTQAESPYTLVDNVGVLDKP